MLSKLFGVLLALSVMLTSCLAQDDGLIGPPPPIPYVGPDSRAPMTFTTALRGKCGSVGFDLSWKEVETATVRKGTVASISRMHVVDDGILVESIQNSLLPDRELSILAIRPKCDGASRLHLSAIFVDRADESVIYYSEIAIEEAKVIYIRRPNPSTIDDILLTSIK